MRTCGFVAGWIVLLMSPAAGAQCYDVTVIPVPPCGEGSRPTWLTGINESGEVCGYFWSDCIFGENYRAFTWSPETGLTILPLPPGVVSMQAYKLTGALVVGELVDIPGNGTFAFKFDGSTVNEGSLPNTTYSQALGVNNAGQVVGNSCHNVTGPCPLAFLWQGETIIGINPDFGTENSIARDINDLGQATGWMGASVIADGNAFIWEDGAVTVLSSPPGAYLSEGFAINTLGYVVGSSRFSGSPFQSHAVLWIGDQALDIGVLPGLIRCAALDINDSNWIVGRSWHTGSNPNITSAFIWRNGAMTDLSSLILTKSGITIARASAINNAGQIAAQGEPGHVGVLLTPAPGPPGDLNADCVVGIVDLLALLGSWGPCPGGASCTADLDDDGTVGVTDFLTLLANWS